MWTDKICWYEDTARQSEHFWYAEISYEKSRYASTGILSNTLNTSGMQVQDYYQTMWKFQVCACRRYNQTIWTVQVYSCTGISKTFRIVQVGWNRDTVGQSEKWRYAGTGILSHNLKAIGMDVQGYSKTIWKFRYVGNGIIWSVRLFFEIWELLFLSTSYVV